MPGGRGEDNERSMFAEELIAMRKQRGWTQEELAARVHVAERILDIVDDCKACVGRAAEHAPAPRQLHLLDRAAIDSEILADLDQIAVQRTGADAI